MIFSFFLTKPDKPRKPQSHIAFLAFLWRLISVLPTLESDQKKKQMDHWQENDSIRSVLTNLGPTHPVNRWPKPEKQLDPLRSKADDQGRTVYARGLHLTMRNQNIFCQ